MTKNNNTKALQTFDFIDGNTLMAQEYDPLEFAIDEILPHGLFIIGGSGKIGKSWLALDMGITIATGSKLWEFSATQGGVLYLALEDNRPRLQARLDKLQARNVDISNLKMSTESPGINSGLIEYTHNFLKIHPNTKLIIVDTLERVRDSQNDRNMYACDYRDMNILRDITNKHKVTLLLIHHTRKMSDPDPLNTLSGSTGLIGAVDGVFVLEKETRTDNKAKLTIVNRDTKEFCFNLELDSDTCKWNFIGNDGDLKEENQENLFKLVDRFLKDTWTGTATELCNSLKELEEKSNLTPLNITKQLKNNMELFKKNNIEIVLDRNRDSRTITISRKS